MFECLVPLFDETNLILGGRIDFDMFGCFQVELIVSFRIDSNLKLEFIVLASTIDF